MNTPGVRKDLVSLGDAVAMLPPGEYIHTFRNPAGVLLGADLERGLVLELLANSDEIMLTGGVATAMGHGLAVMDGHGFLFIATKKGE